MEENSDDDRRLSVQYMLQTCAGAAATSFPASVSLSLVDPPATSFVPRLVHLFMLDLVLLLFFSFV